MISPISYWRISSRNFEGTTQIFFSLSLTQQGKARTPRRKTFFVLSSSDGREMPTWKCVLVGDGGTGKTTFVKRHLTGKYGKKYIATQGVDVHPHVGAPLESWPRTLLRLGYCWPGEDWDHREGYYILGQDALFSLMWPRASASNGTVTWPGLSTICPSIFVATRWTSWTENTTKTVGNVVFHRNMKTPYYERF